MNIKVKYTQSGEEYTNIFNINEDTIKARIKYLIDFEKYTISKEELPFLLNGVKDDQEISHSIYGFLKQEDDNIIFNVELISENIAKKQFNSEEVLIKARKK